MTIGSSLSQPSQDRKAVLRAWQVSLCERDHCAAMLLNHFDYWHSWKIQQAKKSQKSNDIAEAHGDTRAQDQSLLQFHTLEDLSEAMMGLFGRTKIISSLKYLEHKEIITKHPNPNPRYTFDKTVYYLFHPEVVNNLYKNQQYSYQTIDVQKQPSDSTELNYRESESVRAAFKNVRPASESERYTEITTKMTNKEIKAAEAVPDIQKIEQPLAASAAFSLDIFVNDLLIDETLTENQLRQVTATVNSLHESGYLAHLAFEHAIQAVTDTLLSRNTYTRAGNDFLKKLNTIKKSIQQGSWTPPVDRIVAQKTAEINALEEWKREYQSRLNEIAHLTQHIERFSEYRAQSLAKNNMTQHVDAALDSSRAQLDALTQALTEFKKARPDINNPSVHSVPNGQHASLSLENKPIPSSQRL